MLVLALVAAIIAVVLFCIDAFARLSAKPLDFLTALGLAALAAGFALFVVDVLEKSGKI